MSKCPQVEIMELKEFIAIQAKDRRIKTKTLKHFVNQKYHWESLPPSDVMKMAVELLAFRQIMGEKNEY